jgi:P-type E1-E2 ATPase
LLKFKEIIGDPSILQSARHMGARKVIVKRLVAIENFGSMNVFCSDKTGTLTSLNGRSFR